MNDFEQQTYDQYIKGVMDISRAITSDLYLEDLLKLIVMVTANVTGVAISSLWLTDENEQPPKIRRPPRPLPRNMFRIVPWGSTKALWGLY